MTVSAGPLGVIVNADARVDVVEVQDHRITRPDGTLLYQWCQPSHEPVVTWRGPDQPAWLAIDPEGGGIWLRDQYVYPPWIWTVSTGGREPTVVAQRVSRGAGDRG